MLKKRTNYLSKLIFYLKETRDIFRADLITLRDVNNYLHDCLDKDSATDARAISQLEKVIDKIDYAAKYYDITIDFYEDK